MRYHAQEVAVTGPTWSTSSQNDATTRAPSSSHSARSGAEARQEDVALLLLGRLEVGGQPAAEHEDAVGPGHMRTVPRSAACELHGIARCTQVRHDLVAVLALDFDGALLIDPPAPQSRLQSGGDGLRLAWGSPQTRVTNLAATAF